MLLEDVNVGDGARTDGNKQDGHVGQQHIRHTRQIFRRLAPHHEPEKQEGHTADGSRKREFELIACELADGLKTKQQRDPLQHERLQSEDFRERR